MSEMIPMVRTNLNHMGPLSSPYAGTGANILSLEKKIGAEDITRAGTFEQAMLQALDKVSGVQQYASAIQQEAIVNPDAIDPHDITIAQGMAGMSLDITRTILNRLVQSWNNLINTR